MRATVILSLLATLAAGCSERVSPSEDPTRTAGGLTWLLGKETSEAIATGQLFITDLELAGPGGMVFLAKDAACQQLEQSWFEWSQETVVRSHHGMRLLVPSNTTLCVAGAPQTRVLWSGFRP